MAASEQTAFIKLLGEPAQKEYTRTHILPSLIIAQGILESGWGNSELTKSSNNLFGRKGTFGIGNTPLSLIRSKITLKVYKHLRLRLMGNW